MITTSHRTWRTRVAALGVAVAAVTGGTVAVAPAAHAAGEDICNSNASDVSIRLTWRPVGGTSRHLWLGIGACFNAGRATVTAIYVENYHRFYVQPLGGGNWRFGGQYMTVPAGQDLLVWADAVPYP
jgi:hypothetical protein